MKFEMTEVMNFRNAIRGARNPMESWDKSDSKDCDEYYKNCKLCPCFVDDEHCKLSMTDDFLIIGKNDMKLLQNLVKAGSDERKILRQIFVSVDITAPLYWWKEMDTYKIGTVTNSESTMHRLATTPITMNCFETDDYDNSLEWESEPGADMCATYNSKREFQHVVSVLEGLRLKYLETKDKRYWKELIRLLPESWLQMRTMTMNYENLRNMYFSRRNHKLTEWSESFVKWVELLPYSKELIMYEGEKNEA